MRARYTGFMPASEGAEKGAAALDGAAAAGEVTLAADGWSCTTGGGAAGSRIRAFASRDAMRVLDAAIYVGATRACTFVLHGSACGCHVRVHILTRISPAGSGFLRMLARRRGRPCPYGDAIRAVQAISIDMARLNLALLL